jgi:hypothetical protein
MKKTLFSLAILTSFAAQADEGMWMPQQLPQVAKQLKAAGLKLDPATLTKLTEFPMGAVVSLGGCSASFVSPQGLVITNHHCVYNSVAVNSTPQRDLLTNGFLAKTLGEELPAAPGSRVFVTEEVANVSNQRDHAGSGQAERQGAHRRDRKEPEGPGGRVRKGRRLPLHRGQLLRRPRVLPHQAAGNPRRAPGARAAVGRG